MSVNSARCQNCGRDIPVDAAAGLCPECLLRQGIAESVSQAGMNSATVTTEYRAPNPAAIAVAFPQYEILALLGQGGMGAVYQARQPALDRFVALKIIRPEIAGDAAFAERFAREARTLARLSHPNIVAVHDFGKVTLPTPVEGLPGEFFYLVLEYVDGASLRQLMQGGTLEPAAALKIVPQICEALQFAHDEGIVHRDIKPENILLDRRGRVKIADFGLAKLLSTAGAPDMLTGTHQVMGTPRYMAPEQMEGARAVDHRADIYSLGVVFYEMLTGRLPLGRFEPPSQRVQLDIRLDEVVLRTLERDPQRRYQQAGQVKTDLDLLSVPPSTPTAHAEEVAAQSAVDQPTLRAAWNTWWAERGVWFARCVQALLNVAMAICLFLFLSFQYNSRPSDDPPFGKVTLGYPSPWFTWETYPEPNVPFRGGVNLLSSAMLFALFGNVAYYVYWQIEKTKRKPLPRFSSPRSVGILWVVLATIAIASSMSTTTLLGNLRDVPPRNANEGLQWAASRGDVSQVRKLLEAGADVNDKNARGETALMHAAANGHSALVKSLALLGADVNEQDQNGATALISAASKGQAGVIHAFAELQSLGRAVQIPQTKEEKETALQSVSGIDRRLVDDAELASLHIEPRVDLADKEGHTALMRAAILGNAECVLELTSLPLNADPLARDRQGNTALMLAAEHNQLNLLRELLAHPATSLGTSVGNFSFHEMLSPEAVDVVNHDSHSAIQIASSKGHVELAELIEREMRRAVAHFDRAITQGGEHSHVYYRLRGHAWNVLGEKERGAADLEFAANHAD